jgi:hypothetical protein
MTRKPEPVQSGILGMVIHKMQSESILRRCCAEGHCLKVPLEALTFSLSSLDSSVSIFSNKLKVQETLKLIREKQVPVY